MSAGTGWVRERAEDVEDRAHPDIAAGQRGVAHSRVILRREHEPEAGFIDTARHARWGQIDRDADGLEKIGGAALAGNAAIAVLGHARTGRGDHQRGQCAYVEGPGTVAARTHDVDDVWAGIDMCGGGAHDLGETGDLVGRFALHAQGDGEASDLGRRGFAFDERGHGGTGFGARQILAEDQFSQSITNGHGRTAWCVSS